MKPSSYNYTSIIQNVKKPNFIFSEILSLNMSNYMILTANQMNEISSLLHKFTSWTCLNCTSFNNVNFVMSLMIKLMHHVHSLKKKKNSQSDKRVLHLLAKIFFYCQMTGSLWVTSLCCHDVGQPSFFYLFFTSIIFKF